ncbi:hypothetical protein TNCT_373971 [Trichonephila clavata]|uniref:Uncharacterized protein n=1 Tax=Trichonephila clavata TaxID=2740835 RepID=A0A8X6F1Z6_TRICU|nr:hypothetical protein TNCT_373971 [Trichonephila clavata]
MDPFSLTNQLDSSRPMEPDFCFRAQSQQTTFSFSGDGKTSPKKHKMFQSLTSFQAFDDLSDSLHNAIQAFKNIPTEFEILPEKQSNALESEDDFAPLRIPPEITGFTEEDNENHRAYRRELYFKPSLDVIPEEEEFEEKTGQKRSLRWILRNLFKKMHLCCCVRKRR